MRIPSSCRELFDGDQRGLDVAGVEAGFDQQDVGAAFDQGLGLLVEIAAEVLGRWPPVTLMVLVVGPMEPATKRGLAAVENSSAAWRASSAARGVQIVGAVLQADYRPAPCARRRRCWSR